MAPGWHPSAAPPRRSVGWHRRIFLAVQPGDPHGSLASSPSKSADVTVVTPGEDPRALLCVIEGGVFVDRAARSTGQIRDHDKRPERALTCTFSEPPIGIEPMTYALRVRRSDRLS